MEYRIEFDSMGEVKVPEMPTGAPRPSAVLKISKSEPRKYQWKLSALSLF